MLAKGLALAILLTLPVHAASEVVDGAGMFSAKAIGTANSDLKRIETVSGVPTYIQTFAAAERQQFGSQADKDRYFEEWLKTVAKERQAQGVVVLICLSPGRVQVDFHKNLYATGHKQSEHARIRDAALKPLKAKQYDAALSAITTQIGATLVHQTEQSKPAPQNAGHGSAMFWGFVVLCIVVIAAILIAMFSHDLRPTASATVPYKPLRDPAECTKCGATTRYDECEHCGQFVIRKQEPRPVSPPAPVASAAPQTTHVHVHEGSDPVTTMLVYDALTRPRHEHRSDPEPTSYSPPAYEAPSYSSDSSSGFDFGGGGDFGGGSGGDF